MWVDDSRCLFWARARTSTRVPWPPSHPLAPLAPLAAPRRPFLVPHPPPAPAAVPSAPPAASARIPPYSASMPKRLLMLHLHHTEALPSDDPAGGAQHVASRVADAEGALAGADSAPRAPLLRGMKLPLAQGRTRSTGSRPGRCRRRRGACCRT